MHSNKWPTRNFQIRTPTMQNMSFYSQRWEDVGTQAIHQDDWSFTLHNMHSLQKNIYQRNKKRTRWPIPRTPSWLIERRQNASKAVARLFNLPNHSEQHMAVCGLLLHEVSMEIRKTLEQKSALLILTLSTNAFYSNNLFFCFHVATHQPIAPPFYI